MKIRFVGTLVLLVSFAVLVSGCGGDRATALKERYEKIQIGMTDFQVEKIIDMPVRQTSKFESEFTSQETDEVTSIIRTYAVGKIAIVIKCDENGVIIDKDLQEGVKGEIDTFDLAILISTLAPMIVFGSIFFIRTNPMNQVICKNCGRKYLAFFQKYGLVKDLRKNSCPWCGKTNRFFLNK